MSPLDQEIHAAIARLQRDAGQRHETTRDVMGDDTSCLSDCTACEAKRRLSLVNDIPADVNPGVRRLAHILAVSGYKVCDSGDGETHDHACDRDYPYMVVISSKGRLIEETDRITKILGAHGVVIGPLDEHGSGPYIQANYAPGAQWPDATIDIQNVVDAMLRGAL